MLSLNGVSHILCLLIICKLLSVFLAYCFMKMSFFSFCTPRAIKNTVQEAVTPYIKFCSCINFLKLAFILGLDNVCSV